MNQHTYAQRAALVENVLNGRSRMTVAPAAVAQVAAP
jgi:hypothetical protein